MEYYFVPLKTTIKIKYFVTIDLIKIRFTCYLKLYLTISHDTQFSLKILYTNLRLVNNDDKVRYKFLFEKTKCKSVNYLQITNKPISKLAAMPG